MASVCRWVYYRHILRYNCCCCCCCCYYFFYCVRTAFETSIISSRRARWTVKRIWPSLSSFLLISFHLCVHFVYCFIVYVWISLSLLMVYSCAASNVDWMDFYFVFCECEVNLKAYCPIYTHTNVIHFYGLASLPISICKRNNIHTRHIIIWKSANITTHRRRKRNCGRKKMHEWICCNLYIIVML